MVDALKGCHIQLPVPRIKHYRCIRSRSSGRRRRLVRQRAARACPSAGAPRRPVPRTGTRERVAARPAATRRRPSRCRPTRPRRAPVFDTVDRSDGRRRPPSPTSNDWSAPAAAAISAGRCRIPYLSTTAPHLSNERMASHPRRLQLIHVYIYSTALNS